MVTLETLRELHAWRELGRDMLALDLGCVAGKESVVRPEQVREHWAHRRELAFDERQELDQWRKVGVQLAVWKMPATPDQVLALYSHFDGALGDLRTKNHDLASQLASCRGLKDEVTREVAAWRNTAATLTKRPGCNRDELCLFVENLDKERNVVSSVTLTDVVNQNGDILSSSAVREACAYASLAKALRGAFDQASKGKERHADGLPFESQPLVTELRVLGSIEAAVYQVRKKAREAARLAGQGKRDMAVAELHGAIVYAAAGIVALGILVTETAHTRRKFMEEASDDQKSGPRWFSQFSPGCMVEVMAGSCEGLRFRVESTTVSGQGESDDYRCSLHFVGGVTVDARACRLVVP